MAKGKPRKKVAKKEKKVGLQEWFKKSWIGVLGAAKLLSEQTDKMIQKLMEKGGISEVELKESLDGLRGTIEGLRADIEKRAKEIEERVRQLASSSPIKVEDFRKYVENFRKRVSAIWKK